MIPAFMGTPGPSTRVSALGDYLKSGNGSRQAQSLEREREARRIAGVVIISAPFTPSALSTEVVAVQMEPGAIQ